MSKLVLKSRTLTIMSAFTVGLAMLPGTANAGFFENLFGGSDSAPQVAPSVNYEAPGAGNFDQAPQEIRRFRKHVVKDDKPVLQKATDIWHDKTLRDGDAVMMKDGLHVYNGPDGGKPSVRELPRIDQADLPRKERALLVAMDTTRNDPLKLGAAPDTIASGRSAAVASPVVSGYKITDARGRSVRYVGP